MSDHVSRLCYVVLSWLLLVFLIDHRVEDVAQRNAVTAKDPKKIEGLFISVQQLMEIMLQSRLSLSPQEVEVLASGTATI